jgi:pyruvate dehydrogenase E2 component (dihydrolipoamide acetyltransferase)
MNFKLPDIGEGITEGEILKWLVKEGDTVTEDQPLVEVMTDKVNVQIPSPRSGKVSAIKFKEGEIAKVGDTIMVIDDGSGEPAVEEVPSQAKPPAESASTFQVAQVSQTPQAGQVLAAPATRRLARELGIDITTVKGSGPQGRITDEDVRKAVTGPKTASSGTHTFLNDTRA